MISLGQNYAKIKLFNAPLTCAPNHHNSSVLKRLWLPLWMRIVLIVNIYVACCLSRKFKGWSWEWSLIGKNKTIFEAKLPRLLFFLFFLTPSITGKNWMCLLEPFIGFMSTLLELKNWGFHSLTVFMQKSNWLQESNTRNIIYLHHMQGKESG